MKTHKCQNCGEGYELMHICLKGYYDRFLQQFQESEKCPDCGHDTSEHTRYGCVHKITLSRGNSGYCPCRKQQSEIPDKPEAQYKPVPKESGIKCPDCGCDVNLHSGVDGNGYAVMEYRGCNNYKTARGITSVCSCTLNFEDALNKAIEYSSDCYLSAVALRTKYRRNKPDPQTCVVCDDIYTRKEDIEAGVIFATIDHTRFICETCHRKIIKCVAGRMNQ